MNTISERNTRILASTLVLSSIVYLFSQFGYIIDLLPYKTYLGEQRYFPYEVIIGALLIGSCCAVFFCGLEYIIEELYCLSNFAKKSTREDFENIADKKYRSFIFVIKPLIIFIVTTAVTLIYILNPMHLFLKVLMTVVFIGSLIVLFKLFSKGVKQGDVTKDDLLKIFGIVILTTVLGMALIITKLENKISTEILFNYTSNGLVEIEGGTSFPEQMNISIYEGDWDERNPIFDARLFKDDFKSFKQYSLKKRDGLNVKNVEVYEDSTSVYWSESVEFYKTEYSIIEHLKVGNQTLLISFELKSGSNSRKYNIFNDLIYDGNSVHYTKSSAVVKP